MKSFFRFMWLAAAMLATVAFVACEKNPAPEVEPEDPDSLPQLTNQFEYAGQTSDINSVFYDAATASIYLCAEEVTSVAELEGTEYACLNPGTYFYLMSASVKAKAEAEAPAMTFDLTRLPEGASFTYYKAGSEVVSLTSASHSAITEGSVTVTIVSEDDPVEVYIDFTMTLTSGSLFRGNALWDGTVIIPDEEPPVVTEDPEYPETPNTVVIAGVEVPFASVSTVIMDGAIYAVGSPEEGLDFDSMLNVEHDFFYGGAMLSDTNVECDLTSYETPILITACISASYIIFEPEILTYGKAIFEYDEETGMASLKMAMTLIDGTSVCMDITSEVSQVTEPEGNVISVNGDTNPVNASFYFDDSGYTYLYFTSAAIDYFGEIENAVDFFYILLSEDDLTGNDIDISTSDKYFWVGYTNNYTGESDYVMTGDTEGYSGTINVSRSASDPTWFTAKASVSFASGITVDLDFDGSCLSVDYVPEEPNEFTYNGVTEAIQSVLVDKRDSEIWHIYASSTGGLEYISEFEDMGAIHITAPSEAFDGDPVGFSTYKGILKFEYDGNTWQFMDDNSMRGTLTVLLDGTDIELDFTNYDNFQGHYSGTAVIVQ